MNVTNRKNFVDDENFRIEMRCNGKRQAHEHSARVAFDGSVDELMQLREFNDSIELLLDLGFVHAEYRAVEKNILAAGELRMKSGPDFEKTRNPSAQISVTFS